MLAGEFIQTLTRLPQDLYLRIIYELDKHPEQLSYAQNNFKRKAEALRSNDPQALRRVVDEEVQELRDEMAKEDKKLSS